MEIEFRRFLRSKSFFINFFVVIICFLLGYVLLKSIDKIEKVEVGYLLYSGITVYSEFGFFIFPIVVMLPFSKDYSKKNIFFYKLLEYDGMSYFWNKVVMIFLSLSIPTIICLCFIGFLYGDFKFFKISLFYIQAVLVWQVLLFSVLAFLLRSIIVAYTVNIFLWLASLFLIVANKNLYFLAYFDAATPIYKKMENILIYNAIDDFPYLQSLGVIGMMFVLTIIIIYCSRKSWFRYGI